jgi:class 3 adenylate cyclase/tetratricopeptide (TPR) repeat protein
MAHQKSEFSFEGERRQVTVLFADLVGFTAFSERAGEEAAYGLMQYITKLLRSSIEEQGGAVKSFTGDGVMALFGVPQALEDAPLRACRAALSIQERAVEQAPVIEANHGMRPRLRIGINTGLAVVGQVESTDDASTTALGDAVNLASRLQELCEPGCVILSEATQRLVDGMVESRFDGERQIRGKLDPQRIFRLESIRQRAGRFDAALHRGLTTFVGRELQLEALERSLLNVNAGVRVADVAGEPGIGKSRLLFEFRKRIAQSHIFILSGSCSQDGQRTAFLPFIEVVRGSFQITSGDGEAVVARKLADGLSALGLFSAQNLGLMLNLLGLRPPPDALHGLDRTLIGLRTRDLLLLLLNARCQLSSVLMIVEDLHWIDSASEELLTRIIEASGPLSLMIVHTRRPEYQPPWLTQPNVSRLPLMPLSADETARIVRSRLGAVQVPEALARVVAERSEGNALFAEEIATFLVENAVVQRQGGELRFDAAKLASTLPISLQSLLSARIGCLSSADRSLLQAAAVIGRQFAPDLLAAVVSAGDPVEPRLAAIEALDLVHRLPKSAEYTFKHALVRDALYDSLLSAPRARLHQNIAEEIERRSNNRLVEVAEVLAHHYSATACIEKAFRYLSLAGRKSLDVYSIEEAQQFFRRALALTETERTVADQESIANAIVGLLEATFMKCDMPETRRAAEFYLPRLEAMGNSPQLAFALYFLGSSVQNDYDFKAADRIAKQALEVAERTGDICAIAYARMLFFNCSTVLGRFPLEISERIGLQVLSESEQAGDNYVLNWAYFCIAWDYGLRGLMKEARSWAQKLMEAGQKRGDGRALGFAHLTMAWLDILDGRYVEALRNAETCLEVAVTQFDRVYGAGAKAIAAIFTGQSDEGLRQLLELRRSAIENGLHYAASGMHGPAGVGLVITGRMAEGIRIISKAIDDADATGDCGVGFWNRIFLAEIYLELLTSRQMPPLRIVLKNLRTILGTKLFGKERARALLEQANRFERLHERGVIRARINMDLGLLHKIEGRRALARQFLEKGRGPAEQQGATFIVNKIDAALAELR